IASLVGGIILFFWQFLSWSMLNVHGAEMTYTPNEDKILEVLSENLTEGSYFLPGIPPETPSEEHEALMMSNIGKPWVQIQYHESMSMAMGMNMFRAFVIDVLAIFLLTWILLKIPNLDFKTTLLSSLAVGAIGYLTITYLNAVWFETNTIGHLIDLVVSWGLVGTWLGWYLNR
ncbi:hypothetical protein OAF63_01645, partial [Saprospiraceae bacterium]|nr:hypothetical protein [Saprospiraceae bacterium]